mgnify:CR=1 FL=1
MDTVVQRFLIPKFNELNMNASGEWLESLETEARENVGVIRGRDYSEWLAKGRGPNHDQSTEAIKAWVGWAGSTFMADWVRAKGLSLNPYAVAMNIAKDSVENGGGGTRYYKQGGTDLLEVLESDEVVQFLQDEYRKIIAVQVKIEFERNLKEVFV